MRIEYEGLVEQQPTYQHVGYTAAATDGLVTPSWRTDQSLVFGIAVLGIALVLIGTRQTMVTRKWGWIIGIMLGLSALGLAWMLPDAEAVPEGTMAPELHATLYWLERTVAETEAAAAQRGRPLNPSEWEAMYIEPPRDGWHNAMWYVRLDEDESGRDGRSWHIVSAGQYAGGGSQYPITSEWLGADGRFGTADDTPELYSALRGVDLTRYQHYRTAR